MTTKKTTNQPVLKGGKSLVKIYAIGLALILLIVLIIVTVFFINYWLSQNKLNFRSPLVLQSPIVIEKIETEESKKMQALELKIQQMEASEASRPADAPIINRMMNDAEIIKKNNIR
jgi:hypothetical protein